MVRNQEGSARSIGGLAEAGGVGVETVRFYQRRGLIRTPSRDAGMRRYDEADLHRLRFIRRAQAAGFTLDEIGELIDLDATEDRARVRTMARQRIALLDRKIAELRDARDALERLAVECGHDDGTPCPILAAFDEAAE
jgi:MerR family transcriptional regulator, mercuric resistance operon regulatory protein